MTDEPGSVLVTGAGGGIGRAMCEAFGAAGHRVLAVDVDADAARQTARDCAAEGIEAAHFACDVGDRRSVERLGHQVREEHGDLAAVCNNAGVFEAFSSTGETTIESWDRVLRVNLRGPFLVSRELIPLLRSRGGGAIVNTASVAGMVAGAGGIAYTTTKHGVVGLTRRLAFECGRFGIRVNAIAPGVIATGMSMPLIDDPSAGDFAARRLAETPARRFGEAAEVARLAVFLAGPEASFIQGALIPIDGGWTAV